MAHSSALVLLLVAAFLPWIPTTSAFLVLVERTPSSSSRHRHDLNHYNQRRTSPILVATFLDSLPDLWSGMGNDANTNNKNVAAPKISQTLVEILLARRQRGISSGEMDETVIDATIQTLIQELADLQVTFDPEECLNGPLFVVLHQQGPKVPLWEKIGFLKKKQGDNPNIQGQQYSSISDMEGGGNEPVEADFKVRNYAEILGKNLYIQVEGFACPTSSEQKEPLPPPPTTTSEAPKAFFSLSLKQQQQTSSKKMIQCPWECVASVEGGGIYVRGNKIINLPIAGTGVTRVLYADPNLRIFQAPNENNGGWENQGLITVQVREDLLPRQ